MFHEGPASRQQRVHQNFLKSRNFWAFCNVLFFTFFTFFSTFWFCCLFEYMNLKIHIYVFNLTLNDFKKNRRKGWKTLWRSNFNPTSIWLLWWCDTFCCDPPLFSLLLYLIIKHFKRHEKWTKENIFNFRIQCVLFEGGAFYCDSLLFSLLLYQ